MSTVIAKNITPEKFRENFDVFANMWSMYAPQIYAILPEKLVRAIEENMVHGINLLGVNLTNSQNSSLPPSKDSLHNKPDKTPKKSDSEPKRKPGGQPNHPGHYLQHFAEPDQIITIKPTLPEGVDCFPTGQVIKRQVIDVTITSSVIEYQAIVYEDEFGNTYVGDFPDEAKTYIQYGLGVREFTLFLSVYQLIPYERVADTYLGILGKSLSEGTVNNFIRDAYEFLIQDYLIWAKCQIINSDVAFFDETPVNILGNYASVLVACTDMIKILECHPGRSKEDLNAMAVLPFFTGIAMSDNYAGTLAFISCYHVLCGAHLLRELTGIHEKGDLRCGLLLKNFFKALKEKVDEAGGALSDDALRKEIKHLNNLLTRAYTEIEDKSDMQTLSDVCIKFTKKASALLNRIVKKMDAYLAFATDAKIPFDNNMAERALRMIKVLLKISGCFRTIENANMVCIIRGYIDTCRAHGMTAQNAIKLLVKKQLPDFVNLGELDQDLIEKIRQETQKYIASLKKDAKVTDSEANKDAEAESCPKSSTDAEMDSQTEPKSEAEPCPKSSTDAEMDSHTEVKSEVESCPKSSTDAETDSQTEAESEAEPCPKSSTDAEMDSQTEPKSEAETCSKSHPDAALCSQIATKSSVANCFVTLVKPRLIKRRKIFLHKSYAKYNDSS